MLTDYTTPDLIYLLEKLDRLRLINAQGTNVECDCGGTRRGSFPACRECIVKEIDKKIGPR